MTRLLFLLMTAACGTMHVAPVKVEPIHMTIDVNLHDGARDTPITTR
jgi:hypothetical protein